MTPVNEIEEIRKVRVYVRNAEAEIGKLGIVPRVPYLYPFDIVALAILSKAFALSKACLALLACRHSDEAYGLCRSLVECATNLRYLTAEPALQDQRSRDFVKFAMADKAYWMHYALEQFAGRKEEVEIREYAKKQGLVADPKSARRHWSGLPAFIWDVMNVDHPLDGAVTPTFKKISYAADYHQTSAFVHCSLPAIDNYYVDEAVPFRISDSSAIHETSQSTLFILLIYLHNSIAYALFGMNLERPARVNTLFQEALNKMKPISNRRRDSGA